MNGKTNAIYTYLFGLLLQKSLDRFESLFKQSCVLFLLQNDAFDPLQADLKSIWRDIDYFLLVLLFRFGFQISD